MSQQNVSYNYVLHGNQEQFRDSKFHITVNLFKGTKISTGTYFFAFAMWKEIVMIFPQIYALFISV